MIINIYTKSTKSHIVFCLGSRKSLPVQLSNELTEFFDGVFEMPRTEVTKRIWDYIRENNLQNPNDKREIICDEKFEKLFKKKKFNMFKMVKYLSTVMISYGFISTRWIMFFNICTSICR